MATLNPIVSFDGIDGADPISGMIMDASGDLFGETRPPVGGNGNGDGQVYEIKKTDGAYATTATVIAAFDSDDAFLIGGVTSDSAGNLFGVVEGGDSPANGAAGTVFEIEKTGGTFASTPTVLAFLSFSNDGNPVGGLVADAAGDLFGTTTNGGADGEGAVFEIAKTGNTYSGTPIDLASFASFGEYGPGGLIIDAQGDLFGTSTFGGDSAAHGYVFELKKSGGAYETSPTILALFNGIDGASPEGGLVTDANGDLFGTTSAEGPSRADGTNSSGTVFEIQKTGDTYSSTPIVLAAFPVSPVGFTGGVASPSTKLSIDAAGDLFLTQQAGIYFNFATGQEQTDNGEVFEIAKTGGGYNPTPILLASFDGLNGSNPVTGVVADSAGNLFGTTASGGAHGDGTVFEITGSGFVPVTPPPPPLTGTNDILWQSTSTGQVSLWDLSGDTRTGGGPVANLGPSWQAVGTGDFDGDGKSDILWQNTSTGQTSIWTMDGNTHTGGGAVANLGPSWRAIDTGDFDGDGKSDILWQNANGQVSIWEMDGNTHTGGGAVANLGPSWKVAGTGDFNGDGKSDILWQNTDGQVSIWEMDGNTRTGGGSVANLGPDWHAVGTGDYNGDGKSDILWQNTSTGQVSIWEMDGNIHNGGGPVRNLAPSWHAVGTNGGGSDILWHNTSGQTSIWQMNGNTIAGAGAISPNLGPSWHAVGLT